jgi:quercetin dioxygenase-like cupin family protein
MEIFDLMDLEAQGYENRKVNVFFQNDLFKTRVIVLEANGKIPECQMDSYVMFYVVKGEVILRKNNESSILKESQVFITEPALLSMETKTGARLMGVQINVQDSGVN